MQQEEEQSLSCGSLTSNNNMAAQMKYADILMVGKTGNGKSALGNMILQNPVAFESENQLDSVTQNIQYEYSEFEGTEIKIVDGPGVCDTMENKVQAVDLVIKAMTRAVMTCTDGFHAILIVVRYGGRFTHEDVQAIQILKQIFGEAFISNHGILVMTCGDLFMIDSKEKDDKAFERWCRKQKPGGVFSELLNEVNNRVILFNNKLEGEAGFEQIRRLLHMIERLSGNGARYTSEIFSEAKQSRDLLEVESKCPLLQEKTIREAGLIKIELGRVDQRSTEKELDRLNLLKTRADNLLRSVIEQDKGTKALSTAISVAENLVDTLAGQIEQEKQSIKLQKEEEELQKKMMNLKEQERKREEEKLEAIKKEKARMEREWQEKLRRRQRELQESLVRPPRKTRKLSGIAVIPLRTNCLQLLLPWNYFFSATRTARNILRIEYKA